jgi:endogenous inhibitor of DNA gyrase (YacG/DUF329 family)
MKGIPSHYSCEEISHMTNEQKSRIAELRKEGLGYKRIAKALGLNDGTVKTYCHRHGMATVQAETAKPSRDASGDKCRFCGAPLVQLPGRKPKKFCSDECRNRFWNRNIARVNRKSMIRYTCPVCGKAFNAYGKHNRKYCSHGCYITDRFGGALCG